MTKTISKKQLDALKKGRELRLENYKKRQEELEKERKIRIEKYDPPLIIKFE